MRIRILFILIVMTLWSCGGGSGGGTGADLPGTLFEGNIVDKNGAPLADVEVFLFETNESSLTDESGNFTLESFKHHSSARFFFKRTTYTNKVNIASIPDDTVSVVAGFMIDTSTNTVELIGASFDNTSGNPDGEPTPEPDITPGPGVTPTPKGTPKPGSTPTPVPTKTPKPSNFDSKGNTSAFGIPKGMKGNITAGAGVWSGQCLSCHAAEKKNRSFGQIKASFRVVPTMITLPTTTQEIANVTAYLNRSRK